MSLSGSAHYEVRADATANSVNGGGFNPTNTNFMTDLTTDAATGNTTTPVVSSATYNFVAGDVGAYVFIKSGTNWIPGWYVISSVAANKATLNAAIGAATLFTQRTLNTAAGVATVGTPTNGTFSVDYTHKTAAIVTNTDGAAAATTTFTSAGSTFTRAMIGNYIHITVGGGLTVGWYEVVNFTSATQVVLDRSPGTGSAATFFLGGAISMNSTLDDDFYDILIAGSTVWLNGGAGTITLGESTDFANQSSNSSVTIVWGFATVRGDNPVGSTRPLMDCGANNFTPSSGTNIRYVRFTGTADSVVGNNGGGDRKYLHVKVTNTSTTLNRRAIRSPDSVFMFCEFVSYRGYGAQDVGGDKSNMIGCWFHSSLRGCADGRRFTGCIFSDFIDFGVINNTGGSAFVEFWNLTVHGANNTRGVGLSLDSNSGGSWIYNSIISGCATGVSHPTSNVLRQDDYNDYFNNDTDVTNWTKGPNDLAVDPTFANVGQVTGTAGKFDAGGSKLIDTTKNFTTLGVVAGDTVYISAGTGLAQAMFYGITSISTTTNPNDTLNLDVTPGTSTTADKVYEIETGHDFMPTNTSVMNVGFPGLFPGGFTTGFNSMGAPVPEAGGGGGGGGGSFCFIG